MSDRYGEYTTVAKDKYGVYYDLRFEHPSWEEKKKGILVSTVRDAFTCTVEEADRLTKNPGRSIRKKEGPPE